MSKEQLFSEIGYTNLDRYVYNEQNQMVEISKESQTGITREKYIYSDEGWMIGKEEFNTKHEKFSTILYEYTYDAQENWI